MAKCDHTNRVNYIEKNSDCKRDQREIDTDLHFDMVQQRKRKLQMLWPPGMDHNPIPPGKNEYCLEILQDYPTQEEADSAIEKAIEALDKTIREGDVAESTDDAMKVGDVAEAEGAIASIDQAMPEGDDSDATQSVEQTK